jgi:hypothetical protein
LKHLLFKLTVLALMLVGLPLLGVFWADKPLAPYLQFPPQTRYVQHPGFSGWVFSGYAAAIVAVLIPLAMPVVKALRRTGPAVPATTFPWWGWVGVVLGLLSWLLAWTRFEWFAPLQPDTFTPLWISYILVVNAMTFRRTGRCLLTHRTGPFLILFPLSAMFWWFFEYLNRFVQNWYYIGPHHDPWGYFWSATLPFSTVLPAVLSTRERLLAAGWLQRAYRRFWTVPRFPAGMTAGAVLLIAALGLAGIGIWPQWLFALLWLSPLLIVVSLQALRGERHILSDLHRGDWSNVMASALAALVCGFFWELWNIGSLAHWEYAIPYVDRFHVFEMPILGYAGYLPFGIECAVIGDMLAKTFGLMRLTAA